MKAKGWKLLLVGIIVTAMVGTYATPILAVSVEKGRETNNNDSTPQGDHPFEFEGPMDPYDAYRYNVGGEKPEEPKYSNPKYVPSRDADILLNESFETSVPPPGWTQYRMGDTPTEEWTQDDSTSHTGTYCAYHDYGSSGYFINDWLVTGPINVAGYTNIYLSWWNYHTFKDWYYYNGVWISCGSPDPADGDYVEIMEVYPYETYTWVQNVTLLDPYITSDTIYIAFVYQGEWAHAWRIDDVLVTAEPGGPPGPPAYHDVAVKIIYPEDEERYNTAPKKVIVNVTNEGQFDEPQLDFHLQVYKEIQPNPECAWFDDMECCSVNWTAYDWDGDHYSWQKSNKRAHSGEWSYHVTCPMMGTYPPNSHDSLINTYPVIEPRCPEGTVTGAEPLYGELRFWFWLQGEFDTMYRGIYDFLFVKISPDNGATWYQLADTQGQYIYYLDTTDQNNYQNAAVWYEWEDGWVHVIIDITPLIPLGDEWKVNFTWVTDPNFNFEGVYIDDVCFAFQCGPLQPLVFQGYKYVHNLMRGETRTIEFPLEINIFENNTKYWIQVYHKGELINDSDPSDDWDNISILIADYHDIEVKWVDAIDRVELRAWDPLGTPVDVYANVKNNGTFAEEDVPVKMEVYELVEQTLMYEDLSGGRPHYDWVHSVVFGDDLWHVTSKDGYGDTYSFYCGEEAEESIGFYHNGVYYNYLASPAFPEMAEAYGAVLKFHAKWSFDENDYWRIGIWDPATRTIFTTFFDIVGSTHTPYVPAEFAFTPIDHPKGTYYNNNEWWGPDNPHAEARYPYTIWPIKTNNYMEGEGQFTIDLFYLMDLVRFFYGPNYFPNHVCGVAFVVFTDDTVNYCPDNPEEWSGLLIDNIEITAFFKGEKVYEETQYVDLDIKETKTLHFIFPAHEYSKYIIEVTSLLPNDIDRSDDMEWDQTFVYQQIEYDEFENPAEPWASYESYDCTWCLPSYWHAVDYIPGCWYNHRAPYMWCGDDYYGRYLPNMNDSLVLWNTTENDFEWIDFTNAITGNFTLSIWIDMYAMNDACYVEYSTDGLHWYPLDVYIYMPDPYNFWIGPLSNFTYDYSYFAYYPNWTHMWLNAYVDISPCLGQKVTFRFRFVSDSWIEWSGFYFDDVVISAGSLILKQDDFSTYGVHDTWMWLGKWTWAGDWWRMEGGVWINNDWLSGLYVNNLNNILVKTVPDLAKAYDAYLYFDTKYALQDGYDFGYLEIFAGDEIDPCASGGVKEKFTGDSGGWENVAVHLKHWLFQGMVHIGWRMLSDWGYVDEGWQIDNVTIIAKLDTDAPVTVHYLSPAEPDGCDGWYKSAVTITLDAWDNVELAATYYRIDGGEWMLYEEPFTVSSDGVHTIEYYSVDVVGNAEDVHSFTIKIDRTAPTASITFPQEGYIYLFGKELFANPLGGTIIIGGITFQASASDATSGVKYVHFEIDGMSYDDTTSPYEIWWHKFDLIPKSYTLSVTPHDNACNEGSTVTLSFTHWL